MEGKYTKISAAVGVIALLITAIPFYNSVTASESIDHSGVWKMQVTVIDAAYTSFRGMKIKWILQLTQQGEELTGTGEKISINDSMLPFSARTDITVKGTVKNEKFVLQYMERGAKRASRGMFKGQFDENKFTGTFTQTASDSKGSIKAERDY
jgi:hypothetical protein